MIQLDVSSTLILLFWLQIKMPDVSQCMGKHSCSTQSSFSTRRESLRFGKDEKHILCIYPPLPSVWSIKMLSERRYNPPSFPPDDGCKPIKIQVETFSCLTKKNKKKKKQKKKEHTHTSKALLMFPPSVFPGHSCISSFVKNTDSETILETMPAGGSLKLNAKAARPVSPLIACYSPH